MAAFFFVVVSRFEVSSVKNNTNRVVGELLQDLRDTVSAETKANLKATLDEHLTTPDMSAEDAEVASANSSLIKSTIMVLGIAFGVGVAIVLLTWGFMKWRAGASGVSGIDYPDLLHILREQAILLGFVAFVETLFLITVGSSYRSLDGNEIRNDAIVTLRNFINKP